MGYYGACMMGYYGRMVYGVYDQVHSAVCSEVLLSGKGRRQTESVLRMHCRASALLEQQADKCG